MDMWISWEDPEGKLSGSKYFRELLLEIQDKTMEEQKHILVENMNAWQRRG